MSKELKLSEMRKWTNTGLSCSLTDARGFVSAVQDEKMFPLGQLLSYHQAILQNAPNNYKQIWFGGRWGPPRSAPGDHCSDYTYRLHPDVVVVDDTAEAGGYEFVNAFLGQIKGRSGWVVSLPTGLLDVVTCAALRRYICTEVEDANRRQSGAPHLGYVVSWPPQQNDFGQRCAFASIDDLLGDASPTMVLQGRVTPTRVVFRRGGD